MNQWHLRFSCISFFGAVCLQAADRTGGMGLLVAYEDYGFIFKMKMTEVSNPMQRKQKRLGMSSNSFDLKKKKKKKNIAALSEYAVNASRRGHGLNYLRKLWNTKEERMNFSSPKTCRSLTAECSLLPPFLSWSEAILLDPKILSGFYHKVSFPAPAAYCQHIKKNRGTLGNAFFVCIFSAPLVLQGMSIRLLGLFCRLLKH